MSNEPGQPRKGWTQFAPPEDLADQASPGEDPRKYFLNCENAGCNRPIRKDKEWTRLPNGTCYKEGPRGSVSWQMKIGIEEALQR
jgi:hypothetical protein